MLVKKQRRKREGSEWQRVVNKSKKALTANVCQNANSALPIAINRLIWTLGPWEENKDARTAYILHRTMAGLQGYCRKKKKKKEWPKK